MEAETSCLGLDEPQESIARETAAPEWDSTPMEFELGGLKFSDSVRDGAETYVC